MIIVFFLGYIVMESEHIFDNTPVPVIETDQETSTAATSKRINASDEWDHFQKSEDGKRATCIYCLNSYAADPRRNGTSSIRQHMSNCKKSPFYKGKKQKTLAFFKKQKCGEYGEAGSNELVAVTWTKAGFQRALASYFVQDELPFRHVEGKKIREYSMYMNTKFFAPSRITVAKDIAKLYEEEKKNKLMKVLQPYRTSIIIDLHFV